MKSLPCARAWYGRWNETEILVWNMPEWNGRFQEWNGRQSSIQSANFILDFAHGIYRKNVRIMITPKNRKRLGECSIRADILKWSLKKLTLSPNLNPNPSPNPKPNLNSTQTYKSVSVIIKIKIPKTSDVTGIFIYLTARVSFTKSHR